jgi:hypothetical protein
MRSGIVSARRVAGWNSLRQDMSRRRRLLVQKPRQELNLDPSIIAARQMMQEMQHEIANQVD